MARKRTRGNGQGTLFKRSERGSWIASWYERNGKRRERSTRTTDKSAAERILAKFVADAALRRAGLIDPRAERMAEQSQHPIERHLAAFEAKLVAEGRTGKHVQSVITIIRNFVELKSITSAMEFLADDLHQVAEEMKRSKAAGNTIRSHVRKIKSFTKWLTESGKIPSDPLVGVKPPAENAGRKLERRMLLPEEFRWLRRTTECGRDQYGICGVERALLYVTAIQTGLRSSELRSLTRGSMFLEEKRPHIRCKAGNTKNRKPACQFIKPSLAHQLKDHLSTRMPTAPVFHMPPPRKVADMLQKDLAAARADWLAEGSGDPEGYVKREQSEFLAMVNHDGERIDFHALRHTCGAWAAMGGASPKEVQTLMRHSSIVMSMDVYGHLFPGQAAQTVHCLPDMDVDEPTTLRATGTCDTSPEGHQPNPQQWQRDSMRGGANARESIGREDSANAADPCLQSAEHASSQTVGAPRVVFGEGLRHQASGHGCGAGPLDLPCGMRWLRR